MSANWANQTIWTADNLPFLRGMNDQCVDLIYLDPPFNSKTNYAAPIGSQAAGAEFKDTWTLDDLDIAWLDLIEAKHPDNKKELYGEQGGHCNGCNEHFLARNLTIGHIIPKTGGGTDHLYNLQLLCGYCNSVKGDRGQEYLIAKLAA